MQDKLKILKENDVQTAEFWEDGTLKSVTFFASIPGLPGVGDEPEETVKGDGDVVRSLQLLARRGSNARGDE